VRIKLDSKVYPNSRISRLNRRFQPLAILARKALSIPRIFLSPSRFEYEFDGMGTIHDMSFLEDSNFKLHMERAIKAGGFDYNIPLRLHQAIWCSKLGSNLSDDGVFVELGTGRGFIMTAICSALTEKSEKFETRKVYLFDTFIPYRLDVDGKPNKALGINPNYTKTFEEVQQNFLEWPNVKLIRGNLPETLSVLADLPISFIHIDLNVPLVEIQCLRLLWNQLLPGAPILIDDYAYTGYRETLLKFNEFAEEMNFEILTTGSGQGIAFKPRNFRK
jgi:hypothetical protein